MHVRTSLQYMHPIDMSLLSAGVQGAADLESLAAQLDEAQVQLEGGNAAHFHKATFLIELLMNDARSPGHSQVCSCMLSWDAPPQGLGHASSIKQTFWILRLGNA